MKDSIICEGAHIEADLVQNSILGPRTVIKQGALIKNTYVIGNDFYSPPVQNSKIPDKLQIGENCIIDHAIIDKHVCLGKGVQLVNKKKLTHYNSEHVYIRDGIIIVSRGANIPDGFIL